MWSVVVVFVLVKHALLRNCGKKGIVRKVVKIRGKETCDDPAFLGEFFRWSLTDCFSIDVLIQRRQTLALTVESSSMPKEWIGWPQSPWHKENSLSHFGCRNWCRLNRNSLEIDGIYVEVGRTKFTQKTTAAIGWGGKNVVKFYIVQYLYDQVLWYRFFYSAPKALVCYNR